MKLTDKQKRILKTLKKVEFVAQNVALAVVLTFFLVQAFLPAFALRAFGFRFLLISNTHSMHPTLEYNDLIVVRKYDINKVKVGDIVSFNGVSQEGEKIIVTHTVVQIVETSEGVRYLRTQGDNAPYPDLVPVAQKDVPDTFTYLGKYVGKSAFLGHFVAFMQSGYGGAMIFINLLGLCAIWMLVHLRHVPHAGERLSSDNLAQTKGGKK